MDNFATIHFPFWGPAEPPPPRPGPRAFGACRDRGGHHSGHGGSSFTKTPPSWISAESQSNCTVFPFVKWTGQFSATQLPPLAPLASSAQHQLHGRRSGAKFSEAFTHLFNKECRHLVPHPQRRRGSLVTSISRGHQTPRSRCGPGP